MSAATLSERLHSLPGKLVADEPGRPLRLAIVFIIGWLVSHPYLGLHHDGIIYFGQLLHRLHPELLATDLYFRFGSQDSYSLFSTIAMWVTDVFGVFTAAPLLLTLTQIAFAVTTVVLAYRLLGRRYAWFGAIFVAVMPPWYGGWHIFSYAENFLTARSVAEPIILLAMVLLLADRRWGSLLLLVVAAAVHPLMALPALAVWWLACALQDRRFYWFALLGVVPPVLGALGYAPFDRLFATYDGEWAAVVKEINGFIIPDDWPAVDWCAIGADYIVILSARGMMTTALQRRFLDALMLITAATLVIGEASFSLLHNLLLTQLQVWRSLWLLHLVAVLFLPMLILNALQRTDGCGKVLTPAWLITALAVNTYAAPVTAAFAYFIQRLGPGECPQISSPLARKLFWLGVVLIPLAVFVRWTPPPELAEHVLGETRYDYLRFVRTTSMRYPIPLLVSLLLLPLALQPAARKWALAAMLLVAAGLVGTIDQRTPWHEFGEHQKGDEHPFRKFIGTNQSIYWDGELMVPWLVLQRPSYYFIQQASGVVFNRDTAMTFTHRKNLLKYVEFQLSVCGVQNMMEWKSNAVVRSDCVPTEDVLRDLCRSDDPPAFMVFENTLPTPPLSVWKTTVPRGHDFKTYYLYSCEQLLKTGDNQPQ